MAINIGDNFGYKGKESNFERDNFDTLLEMKDIDDNHIDEGHISYCKETDKHYKFNSTNDIDVSTGKWREFNSGKSVITGDDVLIHKTTPNWPPEEQLDDTLNNKLSVIGNNYVIKSTELMTLDDAIEWLKNNINVYDIKPGFTVTFPAKYTENFLILTSTYRYIGPPDTDGFGWEYLVSFNFINELDEKQDKLDSGVNIATINGQSLLEGKDITIEGGAVRSVNGKTGNVYILGNNIYMDDSGAYTISEAIDRKQDSLISGQNIATINNQDITKGGNITIEGGITEVKASDVIVREEFGVKTTQEDVNIEVNSTLGKIRASTLTKVEKTNGLDVTLHINTGAPSTITIPVQSGVNAGLMDQYTNEEHREMYDTLIPDLEENINNKIVSITQADYDLLSNKNPNTLYCIIG